VPSRNLEEMQKRAAQKRAQSVQIPKGMALPLSEEQAAEGDLPDQESRKLAPGWSKAIPKHKTKDNGAGSESDGNSSDQVEPSSNTDSDSQDHLTSDSDSDSEDDRGGAPKQNITIDFGD